jgi:hypothetical protein
MQAERPQILPDREGFHINIAAKISLKLSKSFRLDNCIIQYTVPLSAQLPHHVFDHDKLPYENPSTSKPWPQTRLATKGSTAGNVVVVSDDNPPNWEVRRVIPL